MNFNRAQLLLEKISVLLRSMNASPEHVAAVEKDLMRSYIQQLYEVFLEEKETAPPAAKTKMTEPPRPAPRHEPEPAPVERKPETSFELEETPPLEDVKERLQAKHEHAAPKITELPPSLREITDEKPEPARPEPVAPKQEAPPVAPKTPKHISPDLEELFENQGVKELSEKLSQLPIADLTKAFGINERIFTVNELFGGDTPFYNDVVKKLNSLSDFDAAKVYLSEEIAVRFDWIHKDRKKKAMEFIKVVRRRYS
jgi:hypothetical protein